MKRTLRYGLLAGASGLALGIALTGTSALAFNDDLDWDWHNDVKTDFHFSDPIDIEDHWEIFPEGLAMVEAVQIQLGDVKSKSVVHDVYNNQPAGSGTASGSFTFESEIHPDTAIDDLEYSDGAYGGSTSGDVTGIQGGADTDTTFGVSGGDSGVGDLDSGVASSDGAFDGATITVKGGTTTGGSCSNEGDEQGCVVLTVDVEDMQLIAPDALNAVSQLPEVVSAATSVANNYSLTADAGTLLHVNQLAAETEGGEDLDGELEVYDDGSDLEVEFEDADLKQGDVEAESYVWDILNNSVDSSATAISNNISVDVNPYEEGEIVENNNGNPVLDDEGNVQVVGASDFVPDDHLLISDLTQFSYMDVTSTSKVNDVWVNNYKNLGNIDGPVVNSTATSVGNNISVNVGN